MDDLIERLRNWADDGPGPFSHHKAIQSEAAAELERLTAELERLRVEVDVLRVTAARWQNYRKVVKLLNGSIAALPISTNPYEGM